MVPRGTSFETGATACPFVALELDRDRRSERPDYRHRCYAETTPAPRTIAHQERFCLSPDFPGCPIFQDWAVRAAARPVPLPESPDTRRPAPDPRAPGAPDLDAAGVAGGAMAAAGAAGGAAEDELSEADAPLDPAASHAEPESMPAEPWPDSMAAPVSAEMADERARREADEYFATEEQLGAFDSTPAAESAGEPRASPYSPPGSSYVPPPLEADDGEELAPVESEAAPVERAAEPVPAFLMGRATRSPRSATADDQVSREDVVPSWEIDGRFGAEAGLGSGRNGVLGRLLTIVAVVVIIGLGIAAVVLIPGLLSGAPTPTTRPSFATLPSPSSLASPSPLATVIAVVPTPTAGTTVRPSPTSAVPTPTPTAEPTPILYRIKAGDNLAKIARKHGVTVLDILAANPQITDPNHIEIGQIIVIPQPSPTPLPL